MRSGELVVIEMLECVASIVFCRLREKESKKEKKMKRDRGREEKRERRRRRVEPYAVPRSPNPIPQPATSRVIDALTSSIL